MPALSASEAIGDCIKAGIEAEGFTFGSPAAAVSVVKRKVGSLPAGKDPVGITVWVGEKLRSEPLSALERLETYQAHAIVFAAGGHKTGDDATLRSWVDRIEKRVDDRDRQTFATVTTGVRINRATSVGGKPPFDPGALPKDLSAAWVAFEVEVIVTRATT